MVDFVARNTCMPKKAEEVKTARTDYKNTFWALETWNIFSRVFQSLRTPLDMLGEVKVCGYKYLVYIHPLGWLISDNAPEEYFEQWK